MRSGWGCPTRHKCFALGTPTPALPRKRRAVRGKSCIVEPQLIGREVGFWLAWIHWWRGVDFRDRFSHEQALADEFGEAKVRHPQGVQTPCQGQQHGGD